MVGKNGRKKGERGAAELSKGRGRKNRKEKKEERIDTLTLTCYSLIFLIF